MFYFHRWWLKGFNNSYRLVPARARAAMIPEERRLWSLETAVPPNTHFRCMSAQQIATLTPEEKAVLNIVAFERWLRPVAARSLTQTQLIRRDFKRHRAALAGGIVIALLYLPALSAEFIAPYDPFAGVEGEIDDALDGRQGGGGEVLSIVEALRSHHVDAR